jgi:ketosteroid isomerase-like protein
MSQENVQVVRDYFAATNAGDFPRVMSYYADDVEMLTAGDATLESGAIKGREAVGQWFGDWFRSFRRGYNFEVQQVLDVGNTVLAVARHGGTGKASGVEVEATNAYVFRIEDGKIVFLGVFFAHLG